MRVIFLKSTEDDLKWINVYYDFHFPEGRLAAWKRINNIIRLLQFNPAMGKPYKELPKRRFVVPKTPFAIYYQALEDRLEIVRIWDTRRNIEYLTLDGTDQ